MKAQFSELGADGLEAGDFKGYRALITNEDLNDGSYNVHDEIENWQTKSLNARAAYGHVHLQLDGVLTVSNGQHSFSGRISAQPDLYEL